MPTDKEKPAKRRPRRKAKKRETTEQSTTPEVQSDSASSSEPGNSMREPVPSSRRSSRRPKRPKVAKEAGQGKEVDGNVALHKKQEPDVDGQSIVAAKLPPRSNRPKISRKRGGVASKTPTGAPKEAPQPTLQAASDAVYRVAPHVAPVESGDREAAAETELKPKRKPADTRRIRKTKQSSQPIADEQAAPKLAKARRPAIRAIGIQSFSPNLPSGRDLVINSNVGEECRIAVVDKGRLEELFLERTSTQSHVGNIYKGVVTNVEPSIQAAFIDFGMNKNGFLHVSDVQPQYFPATKGDQVTGHENVGRKIPRHSRPSIQQCFKRGDGVIVQVIKEGLGTKGPTLSTYLSIPGRFLVMMPGMSNQGVSRKIEDDEDRRKMRDMLKELELPSDMGFILRTAGLDRTKRDLQRDLTYLQRLWKTVVGHIKKKPAPAELYRESDLVIRTLRDVYTADFRRIVVDDKETAEQVRDFMRIAMPRSKTAIELYDLPSPLFHQFKIERELDNIHKRHVPMRSGGSLVIDSTEALVAIDVNSGKFRSINDAEESALRINLEAAEEIARQLRLRDLGGLIVCDFIDMRLDRNKRAVERCLRDALKAHKERAKILRISAFGLIEMTRQRQRPSITRNLYGDCPHCDGSGVVKMPESVMFDVIRLLQHTIHQEPVRKVTVTVSSEVAIQILNKKRAVIAQIEMDTGKTVVIQGNNSFTNDKIDCVTEDKQGHVVNIDGARPKKPRR